MTTDDQRCWLGRSPCQSTLFQQILITDQATAAVRPESASSDQCGITPGQSFLENTTITGSPQLGCSPGRRGETTVKTDGKHQTNTGLFCQ